MCTYDSYSGIMGLWDIAQINLDTPSPQRQDFVSSVGYCGFFAPRQGTRRKVCSSFRKRHCKSSSNL